MLSWLGILVLALCVCVSRSSGQVACNNSPLLCDKLYSSIVHLGTHNSPFVSNISNSFSLSGNQYYDSIQQLGAGVRLLQAQIHDQSAGAGADIRLCHTFCGLYDAGPLSSWLTGISSWLDSHPNEVVTVLLVNSDNNNAAQLDSVFDRSGVKRHVYKHAGSWPTLADMITSSMRLVTFVASLRDNSAAPYLLDEFTYIFENPYTVTDRSKFSCLPHRPSTVQGSANVAINSGRMFLMNHFLGQQVADGIELPDKSSAPTTNSPKSNVVGSLGFEMQECNKIYGRPPNFVLVDWFNVGPAIESIDLWNGVTDVAGRFALNSETYTTVSVSATWPGAEYTSSASTLNGLATYLKSGESRNAFSWSDVTFIFLLANVGFVL